MKKMFCIKCGRPAAVGNLCQECFLASAELFSIEPKKVFYCSSCSSIYTNKEKFADVERLISSMVSGKNVHCSVAKRTIGTKIIAEITCTGRIRGLRKEQRKRLEILPKKRLCDDCVKLRGGYYEGVIQIRGERKEKLLKNIINAISPKSIASVEKVKEGYNIRTLDKKSAEQAVAGERAKKSFKLVAEKKGKKLYRNFYAVR